MSSSDDSVCRVLGDSRDVNLSGVPAGTEIDPDAYAAAPERLEYAFDGVGNRSTSAVVAGGTPTVSTYTQTAGVPLQDAEVNQYTTVSGGLSLSLTYDLNGNLLSDGTRTYAYDFRNRLVEVRDQSSGTLIARYFFDPLNRRFKKEVGASTTQYLFDRDEIVEERDGANVLQRQQVWGERLRELLQEKTSSATYFAHENAMGSICALSDASGAVVERYTYGPFGETTVVLNGNTGNPWRFHGMQFDAETGFYHTPYRTLRTDLGRWMQRDPIGIWTDEVNLGNGLAFVGNDGANFSDGTGLDLGVGPFDPPGTPEDAEGYGQQRPSSPLGVFVGFEADIYQQYDKMIEAAVLEFNQDPNKICTCGARLIKVKYLDPNLIKSMLIQESGGDQKAWASDPAQVNNPGDWDDKKLKMGLQKGQAMTPEASIKAAIKWLCYKGLENVTEIRDGDRNIIRYEAQLLSWEVALRKYNANPKRDSSGTPHYERYASKILERATFGKSRHVPIEIN